MDLKIIIPGRSVSKQRHMSCAFNNNMFVNLLMLLILYIVPCCNIIINTHTTHTYTHDSSLVITIKILIYLLISTYLTHMNLYK